MYIKILQLVSLCLFLAKGTNMEYIYLKPYDLSDKEFIICAFKNDNVKLSIDCAVGREYFKLKGSSHLNPQLNETVYCLKELDYADYFEKEGGKNTISFKGSVSNNIYEIQIWNDNIFQKSTLDFLLSNYPNVKEIFWMERCEKLNRLANEFLNNIKKYIEVEAECNSFDYTKMSQIRTLHIEFWGMENLECLQLTFEDITNTFNDSSMLIGLDKLYSLTLIKIKPSLFDILNFEDLINLRYLTVTFNVEKVLQYPDKWLITFIDRHALQYLKKLIIFETNDPYNTPEYNTTALTCGSSNCYFRKDINNKTCPRECNCSLNRSEMQFIINCQNSNNFSVIPELAIPIIGNSSLVFNNNNLTQLPNSSLYGYPQVRELHVANNQLTKISVEQLPENLTYLDIRNNSIQYLDSKVIEFLSSRVGNISMKLSGNPWKCNCNTRHLFKFINDFSNKIEDREFIQYDQQFLELWKFLLYIGFCNQVIYVSFGGFLGLALVITIFLSIRKSIILWLYERDLCLKWISVPEPNEDVLQIDAFLAFSHVDLELVEEYVERLEKGEREYKLCFYQRDWLIGESIPKCILRSIEDSKRIIVLMTHNFVNSSWGLFELQSAIKATSMDKSKRLIIILYPEVDLDKLDSELKMYMTYNTYLRRDDPLFWRKLLFSMPHKRIHREQPTVREARTNEEIEI